MTTKLRWTVDGVRVPVQPPVRRSTGHTGANRAKSEAQALALLHAHAAALDPTDPDLTPFGVTLTPAQTEQCRQWATARRDRWTHLNGGNR